MRKGKAKKDLLAVGMCALSAARVPGVATSTVFQGSDTTAGPSVTQCAIKEGECAPGLGLFALGVLVRPNNVFCPHF